MISWNFAAVIHIQILTTIYHLRMGKRKVKFEYYNDKN